ncbi:MAG: tRNA-intron lyase [Thaumarchaeota archaeon]|nr:tRNA-intron lyase [Nitrososphaerota archaeon]
MSEEAIEAELVQGNVVVWDIDKGRLLYGSGFYGKPLGISKPKSLDFDAPLVLDIIEAVYLAEKGKLRVREGDRFLSFEELAARAEEYYEDFKEKYLVYRDLRDKGFIVTPGIKFGTDFAVYRLGPGLEHAPFIVQVKKFSDTISALEIIRSGRLATTVKKYFTVAIPDLKRGKVAYLLFEWWRA